MYALEKVKKELINLIQEERESLIELDSCYKKEKDLKVQHEHYIYGLEDALKVVNNN